MSFLKVFCLMAIFFTVNSAYAENKNPKVIVVGAGLAGLTTAYRLQQQGVDVHVYEARNRVGGRVLTAIAGGHIAELGGQNISDGGEAENIRRLIEEFGLELKSTKISLDLSYFNEGKLISYQQLLGNRQFHPEGLQAQLKDLVQKSQNMREVLNGIFSEEDPLYKVLAVRLAAYEGGTIEKLSPYYAETLYYMLLGGLASAHQENYVNLLSIKGGNGLLPEKLAQTLDGRMHLNKPLTSVSKGSDGSYTLTFRDKEQVKADIIVLAIPCSVYSDIRFEENTLPIDRLTAIKNVQYGTNAKILIPFSKSPLNRTNCLNDRVIGFFDDQRSNLILYYTGEASRFSKDTILSTYDQDRPMIEMGFGDSCSSSIIPVFAQDESFSTYEGSVGYSWPSDPYAKGSYSYIAPGQETLLTETREEQGELVKTLFAPIDQRFYFVGEHASVLAEVPGTMEAACESGERAARMILKVSKNN